MADARPFHWEYHPEPVARELFRVQGGQPLHGTVPISGAKNAALKLMAAATLTGERCRFTNVPDIEDVRVLADTLRDLGVVVDRPDPNTMEIASGDVEWLFVPLEAAAKMRASFILLGPLLARFGRVIMSNPGGDRIGRRPVDLHVDAMRALGASIEYRNGYYFATAPGRLRGAEVNFPFVSVMGTENAMLAATLADGHTTIRPAAQEPEVDDLIAFLVAMGASVERTAPGHDRDRGPQAPPRRRAPRRPRPDRGRDVHRRGGRHRRQGHARGRAVRPPRGVPGDRRAGRRRRDLRRGHDRGRRVRPRRRGLPGMRHRDRAVPGPRDRPPAADLRAPDPGRGRRRHVHEAIFEDRLEWLAEARQMGVVADTTDAQHATITGRAALHGAEVEIGDLRAGASLILAALAAEGTSTIHGAHHVQRGYENIERKFLDLGARIERVSEGTTATTS